MRRILRATATVGASSIVVVLLGAVRYKFIALEVGAEGVGSLGLLVSAANLGVVIFGLGMSTSGVQAIAASEGDDGVRDRVRAALTHGSRALGLLGGLCVVLAGLALLQLSAQSALTPALLIALGATLCAMVVSGAQLGLLNGFGRIRALAACNAAGAVIGTAATILALQFSADAGVIAALAAAPLATVICSTIAVMRLPRPTSRPTIRQWLPQLREVIALGGAVMISLLLTSAVQFGVRLWLEQTQGLDAVGYFQAAWTITSMYLGFVLTALAAEYFPRISAQAADATALNASVNSQVRLALTLGGPVLLWMIVLAPVVLHLLYSAEFLAAAGLLRWQLVGDVLKIAGWAVAFLLLARRARVGYFLGELGFNVAYLALALPLAASRDLAWLGVAYAAAYAVYLVLVLVLASRESTFRLRPAGGLLIGGLVAAAVVVTLAAQAGSLLGYAVGGGVAAIVTVVAAIGLARALRAERRGSTKAE